MDKHLIYGNDVAAKRIEITSSAASVHRYMIFPFEKEWFQWSELRHGGVYGTGKKIPSLKIRGGLKITS